MIHKQKFKISENLNKRDLPNFDFLRIFLEQQTFLETLEKSFFLQLIIWGNNKKLSLTTALITHVATI